MNAAIVDSMSQHKIFIIIQVAYGLIQLVSMKIEHEELGIDTHGRNKSELCCEAGNIPK